MTITSINVSKGIDLFEDTDNKDILQKAKSFALSGLIDNTDLQKDILTLTENRGAYMAGNWKNIIDKLKSLLRRPKIEILGQQTAWLPISVFYVYCPKVKDAKVKIEYSNKTATEGETSVEIFGVGGGATYEMEFTSSLEVESANRSFAITWEFESEWQHVKLIESGGKEIEFCKIKNIKNHYRRCNTHFIDAPIHNYGEDEIDEKEEILLGAEMAGTRKLSIKAGSKLKVSNKLKLEQFGLEVGTDIIAINQFDVNYEYILPGGYQYVAIRLKDAPYWQWELK